MRMERKHNKRRRIRSKTNLLERKKTCIKTHYRAYLEVFWRYYQLRLQQSSNVTSSNVTSFTYIDDKFNITDIETEIKEVKAKIASFRSFLTNFSNQGISSVGILNDIRDDLITESLQNISNNEEIKKLDWLIYKINKKLGKDIIFPALTYSFFDKNHLRKDNLRKDNILSPIPFAFSYINNEPIKDTNSGKFWEVTI